MIQTHRSIILELGDSLLDFIYPPLCICCGELLDNGRARVCPRCWDSLTRVSMDHPLYIETRSKLLASGVVDELISVYVFEKEGAFQRIVHSLKYSGDRKIGLELGRRIGERMMAEGIQADFLIPIPLHKRKLRERGYNQSELIADGCGERTAIPVRTDLVARRKFTQTQTALTLLQRRENMEDAFEVCSGEVKGRSIVLIDDVMTTGSTVLSCAHVLRNAGAVRIIAASAAIAE
jgi:ComF family protein